MEGTCSRSTEHNRVCEGQARPKARAKRSGVLTKRDLGSRSVLMEADLGCCNLWSMTLACGTSKRVRPWLTIGLDSIHITNEPSSWEHIDTPPYMLPKR